MLDKPGRERLIQAAAWINERVKEAQRAFARAANRTENWTNVPSQL